MARKTTKTEEVLARQRELMEKRKRDREEFKRNVMDGRRYRTFAMEELLALRAIIDEKIEAKKTDAIKELERQKQEIEKKIGELSE